MNDKRRLGAVVLMCLAATIGCGAEKPAPVAPTQKPAMTEADLATVKLTSQAEARLGIRTAAVEYRKLSRTRTFGGEVVVPLGRVITVSAPVAGTIAGAGAAPAVGAQVKKGQALFRLVPLLAAERDLRIEAEKQLATSQARLDAATSRLIRSEQVLRDKAGTARAVEEARAEVAVEQVVMKAARARLDRLSRAPLEAEDALAVESPADGMIQQVRVAAGQKVPAGAVLFEVATLDPVWIRVPVYVGDLATVQGAKSAQIHGLADAPGTPGRKATAVAAPPSADAAAATADLFFELENRDATLRPGQRVGVTMAVDGEEQSMVAPRSAVVYDIHGGAWVYENPRPQVYVRRRVEVRRVADSYAVLGRGVAAGTKVVTAGAAELYGTEFGAGK